MSDINSNLSPISQMFGRKLPVLDRTPEYKASFIEARDKPYASEEDHDRAMADIENMLATLRKRASRNTPTG